MNRNLYVDVHVLQTVPASCVNRDDTGSPKTAVYGGTTRARVSSQAWKKAMRDMFRINDEESIAFRTRIAVDKIKDEIRKIEAEQNVTPAFSEEECSEWAEFVLSKALSKKKSSENKKSTADSEKKKKAKSKDAEEDEDSVDVRKTLLMISQPQIHALADLAVKKYDEKDNSLYKAALNDEPSLDILLFGRMVASDPSLNYDAAAQVAHSISTHTVHNEYDYFTAVDDCSPEDNAGAGHLGTVEFNSSTLYRYATVNGNALSENLGVDTAKAIRGFLEAFVRSMPTGKQNTFANRTLPDLVYVTIREDQPVNLAGAFEKPVSGKEGYAEESVRRLFAYADTVYTNFAGAPALALCACNYPTADGTEKMPLSALLDRVEAYAEQRLADGKGGK